jgi:hypothetical protein
MSTKSTTCLEGKQHKLTECDDGFRCVHCGLSKETIEALI